jgi:hypothetical protein
MTTCWAVRLDATEVAALGRLRLHSGVQVLELAGHVWLQGSWPGDVQQAARLDRALRCLPGADRFDVLPGGRLRRREHLIPRGRLPEGRWQPLSDWLKIMLPSAALPGRVRHPVPLRLVRSQQMAEPGVLLLEAKTWCDYAAGAPGVRLRHWEFAVDAAQRAVVRGRPIPPLPGQAFVDYGGLAVPVGWTWAPAVDAPVLRRLFKLGPADLVLWQADNTWELIAGEQLVPATRWAARASAGAAMSADL